MFARNVTSKLKPNSAPEFSRLFEKEVLPIFRRQKGFLDEFVLIKTDNSEALVISLWDTKENADLYGRTAFPEAVNIMSKLVEGSPNLETFEVNHSTFHKIAAKGA
jgi:heme-degrading monooxygenase HmoA